MMFPSQGMVTRDKDNRMDKGMTARGTRKVDGRRRRNRVRIMVASVVAVTIMSRTARGLKVLVFAVIRKDI